jgi:hypothetical protein
VTTEVAADVCRAFDEEALTSAAALLEALRSPLLAKIPVGSRVVAPDSGLAFSDVFCADGAQEARLFLDRFAAFESRAEFLGAALSEELVLATITEITGMMWSKLASLVRMRAVFSFAYNDKGPSGATEANLRPDETDYLGNFMVSKSEHEDVDLQAAIDELQRKMRAYNQVEYGPSITFLPVIAAASIFVEYGIIDVRDKSYTMVERFDLGSAGARAHCFVLAINFFRYFRTLEPFIPKNPVPLYKNLGGDRKHVLFMEDHVLKRVYKTTCPDHLYALLGLCNVPGAVQVLRYKNHVKVSPVGTPVPPGAEGYSEKDVRRAVATVLICLSYLHERNFVHRDVRWENVVREYETNAAGETYTVGFLVIDFECAAHAGDPVTMENYIHSQVVPTGHAYLPRHDLILVANMVQSWADVNHAVLSHSAAAFVAALQEATCDANAAFMHAWIDQV